MSRRVLLCAFVALVVACNVGGAALNVPRPVARVLEPPMLDGKLDDWPATPLMVLASAADWNSPTIEYGGPEDVSAELRLAWDATALYVAIKVRDSKLVRVPSANEIDRSGDSVVFGIVADGAKESNEFAIALLSSGPPRVYRTEPAAQAGEMKAMQCAVDPRGRRRWLEGGIRDGLAVVGAARPATTGGATREGHVGGFRR